VDAWNKWTPPRSHIPGACREWILHEIPRIIAGFLVFPNGQTGFDAEELSLDGSGHHYLLQNAMVPWHYVDDDFHSAVNASENGHLTGGGPTTLLTSTSPGGATLTQPSSEVELPTTAKRSKKVKFAYCRIRCPHGGCEETFSRNYELKRHQRNIHDRTFTLLCPVYGCNRNTQLFRRPDKFHEHVKKHNNPQRFLCLIERMPERPSWWRRTL
jgi:hypothetical protein